jgi:hypothetical protein
MEKKALEATMRNVSLHLFREMLSTWRWRLKASWNLGKDVLGFLFENRNCIIDSVCFFVWLPESVELNLKPRMPITWRFNSRISVSFHHLISTFYWLFFRCPLPEKPHWKRWKEYISAIMGLLSCDLGRITILDKSLNPNFHLQKKHSNTCLPLSQEKCEDGCGQVTCRDQPNEVFVVKAPDSKISPYFLSRFRGVTSGWQHGTCWSRLSQDREGFIPVWRRTMVSSLPRSREWPSMGGGMLFLVQCLLLAIMMPGYH